MENHEPLFNEVKDIVSGIRALMDRAYQQYSSLVDAVIKDEITDINQIERIMDGLVDLGDDVRFIEIYDTAQKKATDARATRHRSRREWSIQQRRYLPRRLIV